MVLGDAMRLAGTGFSDAPVSARLTAYPTDLLASPLDQRSATFTAAPGGPSLPAWSAPDAEPLQAIVAAHSLRRAPSAVPAPTAVQAPPVTTPVAPTVVGGDPRRSDVTTSPR